MSRNMWIIKLKWDKISEVFIEEQYLTSWDLHSEFDFSTP